MTVIHQDLWSGKLVPSPYKRSELSNRVFCTFSGRKERTWKRIPISNSLGVGVGVGGERTAIVNVSISKPKRRFIAQSLSCSPFHRLEMTEILSKGRKTLTHPSIVLAKGIWNAKEWCFLISWSDKWSLKWLKWRLQIVSWSARSCQD